MAATPKAGIFNEAVTCEADGDAIHASGSRCGSAENAPNVRPENDARHDRPGKMNQPESNRPEAPIIRSRIVPRRIALQRPSQTIVLRPTVPTRRGPMIVRRPSGTSQRSELLRLRQASIRRRSALLHRRRHDRSHNGRIAPHQGRKKKGNKTKSRGRTRSRRTRSQTSARILRLEFSHGILKLRVPFFMLKISRGERHSAANCGLAAHLPLRRRSE